MLFITRMLKSMLNVEGFEERTESSRTSRPPSFHRKRKNESPTISRGLLLAKLVLENLPEETFPKEP